MFAIVGHDEKEQEELSRELFGKIMATVVISVVNTLSKEKQDEFLSKISQGTKTEEIMKTLQQHVDNVTIQKHTVATSFEIIKEYMKNIDSTLSVTQKKQLQDLFLTSVSQ